MSDGRAGSMDRRTFLRCSTFSAGAWVLSAALPGVAAQAKGEAGRVFQPSPLLRIDCDGNVTLFVQKQEMGQGVRRSLPVLLAEELDVELARVSVATLPYDAATAAQYNTWASASVKQAWTSLRNTGAAARMMLIEAAARHWNVSPERVTTDNGSAIHLDTGATLAYGSLAEAASRLPLPAQPLLKQASQFKLIGKALPREGQRDKVTGRERFGIDVRVPGMLFATVVRAPTFFGKVRRYDDSAVRALGAGIVAVVPLQQMPGCDNRNGVAIVASSTWLALKAQDLLKVEWEQAAPAHPSSADLSRALRAAPDGDTPALTFDQGGKSASFRLAEGALLSAEYELPFLNQAPMETPNCVASYTEGRYEVWGGFQAPGFFATTLAKAFGVDKQHIFVHLMPMGGAFGRKEKVDHAAEAMQLARHLGRPVQLVFSRVDDMRNSFYRPATWHRLAARCGKDGIEVWRHQAAVASFPGKAVGAPQHLYGGLANDLPYPVADYQSAVYPVVSPIPIGSWRAISYSQNVFAVESFIDELAAHTRADPLQFRLRLLRQEGASAFAQHRRRMAHVLERCAAAIGWDKRPARGRHRGIACCVYSHTHAYVAHAFEVSVSRSKAVRIERVVCAVDCGVVIDPSGFRAQLEGSLVWALSAALTGKITVTDGVVDQQNFSDYQVLRMNQSAALELVIVDSQEAPAGAGEPGVPSVAPALCNAIFAATGQRVRKLPLSEAGFRLA